MTVLYNDFRDDFANDGFCVVPRVIPQAHVDQYVSQAFDWLESFHLGFKREDPATWALDNLPRSSKGGLYNDFGVGHEQFAWDIRQEPGLIEVFAKIWGTEKLLSSFDGVNLSLPMDQKDPNVADFYKPWPHVDQSPTRRYFHCVQGIANLAPNGPEDGGLTVLKGSNKYFNDLFVKFHHEMPPNGWDTSDWYMHKPEMLDWLIEEKGCEWIKVCAGPGDAILWDSRTIHYGAPPRSKNPRMATYVCYKPANLITPAQLKMKIDAFTRMVNVSHDPITFRVMTQLTEPDPAVPASLVRLVPDTPPALTSVGRKLVGIESY